MGYWGEGKDRTRLWGKCEKKNGLKENNLCVQN